MTIKRMQNIYILILITITNIGYAQYISPVDFPIVLTGNVGEIRNNHFHAGIDIKALEGVGSPVKAVADGFVSRVGVSPMGYGKFVSIMHNNGESSIYAHLNDFSSKIKHFVTQEQFKKRSFRIDTYISKDKIPVKAGQVIGYLGNTGSSQGPHLHFEIRNMKSEPINILKNGMYRITDKIYPICTKILVYQSDTILGIPVFRLTQTIPLIKSNNGKYHPKSRDIYISSPSYIAYEVIDYKNGARNTMGIYSLEQYVGGIKNFTFKLDKIRYPTTRYVNALVQYDEHKQSPYHIIKAYKTPNNPLHIYQSVANNGLIMPSKTDRILRTVIADDNDNEIVLRFKIVLKDIRYALEPLQQKNINPVHWDVANRIYHKNIVVDIPKGALYEDCLLPLSDSSNLFKIGDRFTPLQKNITITIKKDVPLNLQNKVLLIHKYDKDKIVSIATEYKDGSIVAYTRNFENYMIAYDTISPVLLPVWKKNSVIKSNYVRFEMSDKLSGIKSYDVYVDNQWVVGAYEPKEDLLQFEITKNSKPISHNIRIVASDNKNNIKILNIKYRW